MKQKQNNFKIIGLLFNILIFVMLSLQTCAALDITPEKIDVIITFDEPKAAKTYYTANAGVRFFAPANTTGETVTPPTASGAITTTSGISVNISCPSNMTLHPTEKEADQIRCDVTFKAANTIDPGGDKIYAKGYDGIITARGKQIPVTLTLKWLPPQLSVISTPSFEKLKAGETKTGTLKIMELLGYKAAHIINFEIDKKELNASGVKVSFPELPESYIAELGAGASKDVQVKLEVPERGITPGNYTGVIYIRYTEDQLPGMHLIPPPLFKVEIQYPKIGLSNNTFVFPDLAIPYQGSHEFTINEVGGFTPIEGIRFNITKAYNLYESNEEEYPGGTSWVTFDSIDFVPAGGSRNVKVYVNVPKSAKIGQYRWEGKIITNYAGSLDISIGGTAALPGCPEMKQKLEGMASLPVVNKNANADGLRKGTLTLLQKSECLRGLNEILTIASATETLVGVMNNVNSYYDKDEIDKAYPQLINSRTEVDRLSSVSTIYPEYADTINNIKNSAKDLWESYALLIAGKLEKNALENQYTDPKLCSDNYHKISILYTKMDETEKALLYSDKSTECQKGYKNAEDRAKELEADAEKLYEEANAKIFTKFNYKVVILIFNYPKVNEQYNESISKYEEVLKLYGVVNKPIDKARIQEKLEKLKDEKEMLGKTAIVYIAIIALIILFSFIRFSRASAKYNRDTLEANLSKVVAEMKNK